jgi:VanZ family protein
VTARRLRVASVVLAALWAALLFWESSRANPFPFLPEGLLSQDKLLHAGAYAVLGGLVAAALAGTRLGRGRVVAIAVALAAAYGATDEWHQSHVPGRDADPADWAADAAGALAGAAAAVLALRGRIARASIGAHADDPPV